MTKNKIKNTSNATKSVSFDFADVADNSEITLKVPSKSGTISITQFTVSTDAPTGGEDGNNSGRGEGANGLAALGLSGLAGGTNAGTGGSGGIGGGWGLSGADGANGANGNNGSGITGAPGGLAGFAHKGQFNVTNSGAILGRI